MISTTMKLLKWLLSIQMLRRTFATGIAGFSHVVDSLSAIKYAKVKTVRDEDGIVVDLRNRRRLPYVMVTMMTVLTKSLYGYLRHSLTRLRSITHIVIQSLQHQSLQSHQTLFTVRLQVHCLTDVRQANHFHLVLTHAYGAEQNGLLASLNSVAKACHMNGHLTVFQIHRQLTLTLLVMNEDRTELQTL